MKLLALDTSSLVASVALLDGGRIVFEGNLENGYTHSQSLMPLMEAAMNLAGWSPADLEGLVVTEGPGSFTGLRIGMATVKGLAMALGIPVAAVSTLHTLAMGCMPASGLIVPVMDARREQVYTAIFEAGESLVRISDDAVLALCDLIDELQSRSGPVLFTGDGVRAYGEKLLGALPGRGRLAPPYMGMQRAAAAAVLGARMIAEGETRDPKTLTPRYLRSSQALTLEEQKRRKARNG